jgi:hypothetical protein
MPTLPQKTAADRLGEVDWAVALQAEMRTVVRQAIEHHLVGAELRRGAGASIRARRGAGRLSPRVEGAHDHQSGGRRDPDRASGPPCRPEPVPPPNGRARSCPPTPGACAR